MNVEIRWHDDDVTIYAKYLKGWTWDDYYISVDKSKQMMTESSSDNCYMIADMTESLIPRGAASAHGMNTMKNKHPKLRFVVIVTQNPVVRTMTQITIRLNKLMEQTVRVAATIEEAEHIILFDEEKLLTGEFEIL